MESISVNEKQKGIRLDKFLAEMTPDISRTRFKSLIEQGYVSCNGSILINCKHSVKCGESYSFTIPEPEPTDITPNPNININVVYEDDSLLVVNKQAGLTVHPGAGNYQDTMVNALLAYCGDTLSGIGGVQRPGIVHRLDKDTSGLLVVAKCDKAHNYLSKQLEKRTLKRTYYAIVWGVPSPQNGTIEGYIGRNLQNRKKMSLFDEPDKGKLAITNYTVTEVFGNGALSLIECRLHTGRTHQIRVHLTHKGHSLIGDQTYGNPKRKLLNIFPDNIMQELHSFPRQALHAAKLTLQHPETKEIMSFEAPIPEDMVDILKIIR